MDERPKAWDPTQFTFTAWPNAPERTVLRCAYGHRFWTWCEQLLVDWHIEQLPAGEEGDVYLYQGLFHLQAGYFKHRALAPKEHQDCLAHGEHQCIYHVYVETYERLNDVLLRRAPVPLLVPEPPRPLPEPPPPEPVDPGGISLGQLMDEIGLSEVIEDDAAADPS